MSLIEKSNNKKWSLGLSFWYCSKSGFGLGFKNIINQKEKLYNLHVLHCIFKMYIVPKGQKFSHLKGTIGRGHQRKVIVQVIQHLFCEEKKPIKA